MPRNSSGNYNLPVAAFVPGGLIKSADLNSNFSDIATAMTQSLATTGVSTMTGPIKAAAGTAAAPSITFNGALGTGLYLAGANQMSWAANGALAASFNADKSVTWIGDQTAASFSGKGAVPIGGMIDFAGSVAPTGWLLCFGQLVSTATYAALFAAIGTSYGSGGGTFGIPDSRGRAGLGKDDMGGAAAGRITVAGGNFDGTVLGNNGGGQGTTILTANLPAYTPSGSLTLGAGTLAATVKNSSTGAALGPAGNNVWSSTAFNGDTATVVTGTPSGSFTGNAQGGSATVMTNLPPAIIVSRIIYAGV